MFKHSKLRHVAEFMIFAVMAVPFVLLPYRLSLKLGDALGLLAYALWRKRREIGLQNIKAAISRGALPPGLNPEEVLKANFRHIGRSVSELVRINAGKGDNILKTIDVEGMEHYNAAKQKGRGVIFVTGHIGNWELLVIGITDKVGAPSVVARRLNNPYLNAISERTRQRYGGRVIYKKGALKGMLNALKKGDSIGILMDQAVLPEEGVLSEFLGAPAWTTKMPVLLSRRTGAPVLPICTNRTSQKHIVKIFPEVMLSGDDAIDTGSMSSVLEGCIKENPAQWLWIHRRWKRA